MYLFFFCLFLYLIRRDLSFIIGERVMATVTSLHQATNCGGMFPFDVSNEVDCASIEFTTIDGENIKAFASLKIEGNSRPIINVGEKRDIYYIKSAPQKVEFDWRVAQKKRELYLTGFLIVFAGGWYLYDRKSF